MTQRSFHQGFGIDDSHALLNTRFTRSNDLVKPSDGGSAKQSPDSTPRELADTSTRRWFLVRAAAMSASLFLSLNQVCGADGVPQSVKELWADFDPRRDPLETEVIREWNEDGGVFRHVRFLVGTFKNQPARMTAIYGFPEATQGKLPAVMHIHGGGQRAFLHEVKHLVSRGYAALSVNWGGNADGVPPFNFVEGARVGDPNTDWGAVDPSQLNVPGYHSILPGPKQVFEDREHPKNCNWYLLTLGCRRGLTFLEQQPEVDPQRLGVHGFSMGGNLTMYVAGTDERVKVAVPGVGGSGWRWQPHQFIGGTAQQDHILGSVETFARTLSFESYSPLIRCPVLHRSGTNDFHGWMDDVYRTNSLIENQATRYCFAPHLNHRLTPEVEVAMTLWLDQFLKQGPSLPQTPQTELLLQTANSIPQLHVTPENHPWPVARCEIYYSVDPDARARFWRSADVVRDRNKFFASLPLHSLESPLFAFANVYFTLPEPVSLNHIPGHSEPVRELCLSSLLHHIDPTTLRDAGIVATLKPTLLIDDFQHGKRDWYQFNPRNLPHLETWSRKITDPLYRGPTGSKLRITLRMPKTNRISIVLQENEWRNYRGPRRTFVHEAEVIGADSEQTLALEANDFQSPDGPLTSWDQLDQLGICATYHAKRTPVAQVPRWNGPAMELLRVEWEHVVAR